jgi:hypothetical protein
VAGFVRFGGDIITFTSFEPDTVDQFPDELGTYSPLQPTATAVPGCRHRPFREATRGGAGAARAEYPEVGVGIGTNWWQSTCPPWPAALAAKASDNITVGADTFRILGDARPFTDNSGRVVKVTFLSERQTTIA